MTLAPGEKSSKRLDGSAQPTEEDEIDFSLAKDKLALLVTKNSWIFLSLPTNSLKRWVGQSIFE